jgi:hypothetical protein
MKIILEKLFLVDTVSSLLVEFGIVTGLLWC